MDNYTDLTINPFKGPASYTSEDSANFYGRESEKSRLFQQIDENTLVLFYGQSGYGKTSIINAGLIPMLKKWNNHLPFTFILPNHDKPFDDYLMEIIQRMDKEISDLDGQTVFNDFEEFDGLLDDTKVQRVEYRFSVEIESGFKNRLSSLFEFLHATKIRCTTKRHSNDTSGESLDTQSILEVRPVLIFDQFEELFTRPFLKAKGEQKNFWERLVDEFSYILNDTIPEQTIKDHNDHKKNSDESLDYFVKLKNELTQYGRHFRFVFSFRQEYLTKFESLGDRILMIRNGYNRFQIAPFSKHDAIDIINKTSQLINGIDGFSKAIVDRLANKPDNQGNVEVEPFLLSLFCFFMYENIMSSSSDISYDQNTHIRKIAKDEFEKLNVSENASSIDLHEDIIDKFAIKYCSIVFDSFPSDTVEEIANRMISKDRETGNYRRRLILKDDLINNEKIGSEVIEKLLGLHATGTLKEAKSFRYLREESFNNVPYIQILHDRLVNPLAVHKMNRELEQQKKIAADKRKSIIIFSGIIILFALGFAAFLINYFNNETKDALAKVKMKETERILALLKAESYEKEKEALDSRSKQEFEKWRADSLLQKNKLDALTAKEKERFVREKAQAAINRAEIEKNKMLVALRKTEIDQLTAMYKNFIVEDSLRRYYASQMYAERSKRNSGNLAKTLALIAYDTLKTVKSDKFNPLVYEALVGNINDFRTSSLQSWEKYESANFTNEYYSNFLYNERFKNRRGYILKQWILNNNKIRIKLKMPVNTSQEKSLVLYPAKKDSLIIQSFSGNDDVISVVFDPRNNYLIYSITSKDRSEVFGCFITEGKLESFSQPVSIRIFAKGDTYLDLTGNGELIMAHSSGEILNMGYFPFTKRIDSQKITDNVITSMVASKWSSAIFVGCERGSIFKTERTFTTMIKLTTTSDMRVEQLILSQNWLAANYNGIGISIWSVTNNYAGEPANLFSRLQVSNLSRTGTPHILAVRVDLDEYLYVYTNENRQYKIPLSIDAIASIQCKFQLSESEWAKSIINIPYRKFCK